MKRKLKLFIDFFSNLFKIDFEIRLEENLLNLVVEIVDI